MEAAARYGGTRAPCDDPDPCEVGVRTGFQIATRLGESGIAGAGLGRFAEEAVGAGAVLRRQRVGAVNLPAYNSEDELRAAFPLPQDLNMLADFAYSSSTMDGVVLLDNPPTYVNHASEAAGANTTFRFTGADKEVLATRAIAVGEELLQDYRDIHNVAWLEALLGRVELQSARQLGEALG